MCVCVYIFLEVSMVEGAYMLFKIIFSVLLIHHCAFYPALPSLTVSHCSIAVKKHHDQGNSYIISHSSGGLLTVLYD